jgi:TatD DNase family protein
MLIDTHAHVNFNAFKEDGEEVLKRSLKEGVFVINVGSQYSTSVRAVEYARKFKTGVWAAVGIHPVHLIKRTIEYKDPEELQPAEIKTNGENFEYEKYLELAKDPKVVAVGEVGLDYHHFGEADNISELKSKQKEVLLKAIKLANEINKPVMLHCWDAYDDLYEILKNNPVKKLGVVHSFVGGYKTAKKFTELGYKIGLNGIVTYSKSYDRLIKELALEDILLETDCPYLAPAPKKGERNEPLFVRYVAEKIAKIKEISLEQVAEKTTENAKKLFDLRSA